MEARRVADRIPVIAAYTMPYDTILEMVHVIEADCPDYDAFCALPKVVEMDAITYGLTGWNSDRGVAFYRSDAKMAKAL